MVSWLKHRHIYISDNINNKKNQHPLRYWRGSLPSLAITTNTEFPGSLSACDGQAKSFCLIEKEMSKPRAFKLKTPKDTTPNSADYSRLYLYFYEKYRNNKGNEQLSAKQPRDQLSGTSGHHSSYLCLHCGLSFHFSQWRPSQWIQYGSHCHLSHPKVDW